MGILGSLPVALERFASDIRPRGKGFVSVLNIARQLGARVCILLETDSVHRHARIDLAAEPPTIYLIRRSPVCGEKYLNSHEDHLLTPRERFSVAHELGHLVAYQRFNVFPATEKSTYWAQEEWMHRFAGALLTPEAVLDECLFGLSVGEPVCPFTLYSAATDRVRLSQEVLATQLCLRRSDIGFMKLGVDRRAGDRERVLRVLFSVAGSRLQLPNNRSHIDEENLLRRLEADHTGTVALRQCALGKLEPQDFNISWRRMGSLNGSAPKDSSTELRTLTPLFWVSIASYAESSVRQLVLW
jgi:IrrE N-terminal-like domain